MARLDFERPTNDHQCRVLAWFAQQTKPASTREAARALELRTPPVGTVRSMADLGWLQRDDWDTVTNVLVRYRITESGKAALRRSTESRLAAG